ncbi:hypothetical protein [Nonomuraea dietziae]
MLCWTFLAARRPFRPIFGQAARPGRTLVEHGGTANGCFSLLSTPQ